MIPNNTQSLQSSLQFQSLSSREACWFCLTVELTCSSCQQRVHTMYPYPPGHFLGLLFSPQSVLLTLGHVHPLSLMPSPFHSYSVQSLKHSQTCLSTLCFHVAMDLVPTDVHCSWNTCWVLHPQQLCHKSSPPHHSFIHTLTMFTLEIRSLPYRYIAGIQLLAVAHLFSTLFYHINPGKGSSLRQLLTRSYMGGGPYHTTTVSVSLWVFESQQNTPL